MAKKSSKLAEMNSIFTENSISTIELSDDLIFEIKVKMTKNSVFLLS